MQKDQETLELMLKLKEYAEHEIRMVENRLLLGDRREKMKQLKDLHFQKYPEYFPPFDPEKFVFFIENQWWIFPTMPSYHKDMDELVIFIYYRDDNDKRHAFNLFDKKGLNVVDDFVVPTYVLNFASFMWEFYYKDMDTVFDGPTINPMKNPRKK